MADWLLALALTITVAATASGGAFFRPDDWYRDLRKPSFTPPDAVFPIAWAVIFATIAAAGFIFIRADRPDPSPLALAAYAGQFVVNALWSYFFFGRRRIDLAFADIVVLIVLVAATVALFAPVSPLAALLFVPYLIWVCFAGVLNGTILLMNATRRTAISSPAGTET